MSAAMQAVLVFMQCLRKVMPNRKVVDVFLCDIAQLAAYQQMSARFTRDEKHYHGCTCSECTSGLMRAIVHSRR